MTLLFESLIEIRNFHGFYQFRETPSGPWQFVVNGFCFDDIHCHVMTFDRKELKDEDTDRKGGIIKNHEGLSITTYCTTNCPILIKTP